MRSWLLGSAFLSTCLLSALSQGPVTGTIAIYRIGQLSGTFPIVIDGQIKLKLGNMHRLLLHVQPGDHQVEAKFGSVANPVSVVHVDSGETAFVVLDFGGVSFGGLMMGSARNQIHMTLERTNAPPEGSFKDQEVDVKAVTSLALLLRFHEDAPVVRASEIQELSEVDVQDALLQGRHTPTPSMVGLYLEDRQQQFGSSLSQGQAVSGFSVRVYTAKQWLQLQVALATREMRPFSDADVTPEMRQILLHVIARPSTPDSLTGRNMAAADNVQRVVLEEGPNRQVIQPLAIEASTVQLESAIRSAQFQGVVASFPQPDVSKPFSLIVIGAAGRKTFEVKDKHLSRLK